MNANRLVWRETSFQPGRSHALEVRSTKPKLAFVIECTIANEPRARFAAYLDTARNFVVTEKDGRILLDGVDAKVELGGADDTVSVTDPAGDEFSSLSPMMRSRFLTAETMTVSGRVLRGPLRQDTIQLFPAPEKLARFEQRCAALKPVR